MRQETPASVSVLRDMALISVEGSGLSGVAGTSARLFGTLARAGISVVMISQGSAESAICIALKGSDVEAAESALRDEFRLDIAKRCIEEIVTRWGVSILTVVTAGMKHRVGAAQRMTSGMARAGVNILSIAQGSSELSVSFAIDHADTHRGARALHEAMRRPTVRVPNRSPRLSVALAGVGLVGRAVLDELSALAYVRAVGLCDSRSIRTHNAGFGSSELAEVIESKKQGHPLDDAEPPGDTHTALSMLDAMLAFGAPNPVLIDCTADPGMVDVVRYALAHGVDVITANKEILACSTDEYRAIRRLANEHGAMLLGEATVGAGMPVARTITAMRNAGDEITSVSASLSGTIAFLMGGLSGGGELDDLVQHAINLGYAEPDPSADVLGDDMRRKALVLARLSGFEPQSVPVVEPFADVRDVQAGTSEFDSALRSAGTTVRRRMKTAKAGGTELRYLLHAEPGSAPTVGFVECDPEGPFGGMTPEQARVVITSRYNDTRPLIISGAGAGDVTTAGGVLADLGLIGASRRCGVSM